jgi:uncharacterized protein (DUF2336 family)
LVVAQFIDWVEGAPAGCKPQAMRALAAAYLAASADHPARPAMAAAITLLLDGARADVRLALAAAFAESPAAPRHIVAALAADQINVATVVLGRSPVFVDAELVDLVARAAAPIQMAIASRPTLSLAVSAAIAEVGSREVCLALLANTRAAVDATPLARIAERFGAEAEVRTALLDRPDLPAEVHQTLVKRVADALGAMVIAKAWVSEARATLVTREATDRATVFIAGEAEATSLPALVEHLRASGQLTTALMLRAICAGNLDFFQAALAALARVPLARVVNLVTSHRIGALRALYAKAGLPRMAFEAFAAALDIWAEVAAEHADSDRYRSTSDVADAILRRYAGVTGDSAGGSELAAMLRRFAADQARDAAHEYAKAAA